jgi:hypothetical protein
LGHDVLKADLWQKSRSVHDPDVEVPERDIVDHLRRVVSFDMKRELRHGGADELHPVCKQRVGETHLRCNPQRAVKSVHRPKLLSSKAPGGLDRSGMFLKPSAGCSGRCPGAAAGEQGGPEAALESADPGAHGGLRDPEPVRREPETAALHEIQECFNEVELHGSIEKLDQKS